MAQVHYWELSNYNNGTLIGKFFDLDGKTALEHATERQTWLDTLTRETGELCEEWILGDAEGVPSQYVGEWDISLEFFDLQSAVANSCYEEAVFLAGINAGIDIKEIEDRYQGEHKSAVDFAEELAESAGLLDSMPENLRWYFDFDSFARDLMINDYDESDGHYFSSHCPRGRCPLPLVN